ncbi:hypothetical protein D9611_006485 [Ephemerocybe angulata]|uniref:BTB domain-containing protein n=1 Tax=Ephemerocybe angulata TaxID=980116 RepID=A0A8H5C7M2_9AGAR|nr:hypothetical protein D9611_006485 [Tulosesus angulatus]
MSPSQPTVDTSPPGASGETMNGTTITRSDIWFFDGSIVLEAERTQFRVHQAFLARNSSVFSDVFSIPHADDEPKVEGCPVLQLQDSAEDIKHMLLAVYDRCYHTREPIPFNAVAAMVRMGRKYEIAALLEEGRSRLHQDYPSTPPGPVGIKPSSNKSIIEQKGLSFLVANLAYECNIASILPNIYFRCVFAGINDILLGKELKNGTRFFLTKEVQFACLIGRDKLQTAYRKNLSWLNDVGYLPICSAFGQPCRQHARAKLTAILNSGPRFAFLAEGMDSLVNSITDGETLRQVFCGACYARARASSREARDKFWDDLPSYFNLPSWEELKKLEDA